MANRLHVTSGKSKLSLVEFNGIPAVKKEIYTNDTFWKENFKNEIALYRLFKTYPSPVPTPALYAVDDEHLIIIIEHIAGKQMADERILNTELNVSDLQSLLTAVTHINKWFSKAKTEIKIDKNILFNKLLKYRQNFFLSGSDMQIVTDLLRFEFQTEFNHGDLLLRNIIKHSNSLVFIDWEFAGQYLEGYDFAFLWVILGMKNYSTRKQILNQYQNSGNERLLSSFLLNVIYLLARELRINTEANTIEMQSINDYLLESLDDIRKVSRLNF